MTGAFHAPAWARSAHLQTIWAPLVRRTPAPPRQHEIFALPDADALHADWTDPCASQPLVIVLHGLAGSGDSAYVVGIQHALLRAGLSSVVMHFRGAGGVPNRRARGYHAGDTGDLDAFVAGIHRRFPQRPLAAIGYSLGGNVLLKWLGEQGATAPLRAACAVSVPFELGACSARLDLGFSRIYRNRLRNELLQGLAAKEAALRGDGDITEADRIRALGDLSTVRTFREYDDRVVAPLHGFLDADDYYRQSSARPFLRRIGIPTRIIHALDDPFMTTAVVPGADEVSATVTLDISAHGGHIGFVQGTPWRPAYWLEDTIPAWLLPHLPAAESR